MKFDIDFTLRGKIDVCHHVDGMVGLVNSIHRLGDVFMAVSADLKALTAKIDDATNKLATTLADLRTQISNSMTDAEVAEVKAGLQAVETRLTALGADPNNPVP